MHEERALGEERKQQVFSKLCFVVISIAQTRKYLQQVSVECVCLTTDRSVGVRLP